MGSREGHAGIGDQYGPRGAKLERRAAPSMDPSLTHPRCVFQLLKKHFRRYTPELVERACGRLSRGPWDLRWGPPRSV
jgi:formate dehydrogenase major subunit